MIVLGLTGSIGMGKSTAAQIMRRLSVPVSDADAIVHNLIGPGGQAVSAIEERFPGSTKECSVDRRALGEKCPFENWNTAQFDTMWTEWFVFYQYASNTNTVTLKMWIH